MKRFFYTALALALLFSSCKKEKDGNTSSSPSDQLSLLHGVPADAMPADGIDGSLQAVRQVFRTQGDDSGTSRQELGYANFRGSAQHSLGSAGDVSLNNIALTQQPSQGGGTYYSTLLYDSLAPGGFGIDSSNLWNVTGNDPVPAFSYDYKAAFPAYTGDIPVSVTKASGLVLIIDTNVVHHADSVFVIVADSAGKLVYKNVSSRAGTVWFTPTELSGLGNSGLQSAEHAWLKIFPYSYTVGEFGGKKFAFVKEQELWQAITIQ